MTKKERSLDDWGFNFTLPGAKLPTGGGEVTLQLLKGVKTVKALKALIATSKFTLTEMLRNFASAMSSADDFWKGKSQDEIKIVVIDLPGAGAGAEVSLGFSGGEFMVVG